MDFGREAAAGHFSLNELKWKGIDQINKNMRGKTQRDLRNDGRSGLPAEALEHCLNTLIFQHAGFLQLLQVFFQAGILERKKGAGSNKSFWGQTITTSQFTSVAVSLATSGPEWQLQTCHVLSVAQKKNFWFSND